MSIKHLLPGKQVPKGCSWQELIQGRYSHRSLLAVTVYLVLCQEHLIRSSQQNWEEVDVAVITHSLQMRQLGNREGK